MSELCAFNLQPRSQKLIVLLCMRAEECVFYHLPFSLGTTSAMSNLTTASNASYVFVCMFACVLEAYF